MTAQAKAVFSVAEYFDRDAQSKEKLEFFAGIVVAQAGASGRHNLIVSNLIGHLYAEVRRKSMCNGMCARRHIAGMFILSIV
ncbi:hypothetical protein HC891_25280 [Candidatus Gracilibacteria bacterium]|nr:hypothetical protein [Candidatus Gracilibacteria bacterium]